MPKLDPPTLFALPHTPDGEGVANVLLRSCIVATLHFCLVIGTFGAWQLCLLWVLAPLTLLHHATLIILLHKHKLETYETGLIPECFTSIHNFICSGIVFLFWFAGGGMGIWIPAIFHQLTAVAWGLVTAMVGMIEFFTTGGILSDIGRLRDERGKKDLESSALIHLE